MVRASDDSGILIWEQRDADMSWREIDEEVIILDLRSASYLKLNPAGAVLWNRLDRGATVGQLATLLAERFGLDVGPAEHDAAAFLESCSSKGIVVSRRP